MKKPRISLQLTAKEIRALISFMDFNYWRDGSFADELEHIYKRLQDIKMKIMY